jgi:ubiquinol-cytochrome c reductase iron-sulfur subunit
MPERSPSSSRGSWGADALVGALLLVTIAAAIGLIVVYVVGGQVQWEGVLLFVAFGALAVAVGVWAKRFMPQGPVAEDRPVLRSSPEERAAVAADFVSGERTVTRRRLLATLLLGAAGAIGAALVVPLRSLGPFPLPSLRRTAWEPGTRLVDADGVPVRADDLSVDGLLTAFPEGVESPEDKASSQIVLIRLGPGVELTGGRQDWTADGHVAFSKVCTHAGCPVGLYQAETHQLVCPCHQSLFDVVAGAAPVFGPATRALPQLPLEVRDGDLVAGDDFQQPVGPGFWTMDRDGS